LKQDSEDQGNSEERKSSNFKEANDSGTDAYLANVSTDLNANSVPVDFNKKSTILDDCIEKSPINLDCNKNSPIPLDSQKQKAKKVDPNSKPELEASIKRASSYKRRKRAERSKMVLKKYEMMFPTLHSCHQS